MGLHKLLGGAGLGMVFLSGVALALPGFVEPAPSAYARDVFIQGSRYGGMNGLVCDAEDRLLIASNLARDLKVLDTTTGNVLATYGVEQGVDTPDDVAVGPDGSIYWTNIVAGTVGRRAPDGTTSTVADLGLGVNAVRVSPDGMTLYVSKAILGDALYAIDLAGGAEPRLVAENVGWPNSMAFGPDGRLYSPLNLYGEIVRWDLAAGTTETVADGLEFPVALKFDSQGRMVVCELLRGTVLRIDPATGTKTTLATLETGLDNLAIDSQDRLFVSNSRNGSLVEILADGTIRHLLRGGILPPSGLALQPGAGGTKLYLADFWSVREFDVATRRQTAAAHATFSAPPLPEGRTYTFNRSGIATIHSAVTVAPDGNRLLLSSWFDNAVEVYDPAAKRVVEAFHDFQVPLNAIRFQGDLVVAELGSSSVVRRAAATGERTTIASGLPVPTGLAATSDDLWVAEWTSGRVLQIVADGTVLADAREVATGLAQPEGLTVAPDGSLLVVEAGAGRLSRIDPGSGAVSLVAGALGTGVEGIPGFAPSHYFSDVAVDANGVIYVSCDRTNQVVRLTPQ